MGSTLSRRKTDVQTWAAYATIIGLGVAIITGYITYLTYLQPSTSTPSPSVTTSTSSAPVTKEEPAASKKPNADSNTEVPDEDPEPEPNKPEPSIKESERPIVMTATDFMKELDRKGHTWCEGRFFEISGPLTYRLGDDIRVGAGRNAKGLDLEFPEVKCQGEPVDAYFLEEEIKTVLKKGAVVTIRGKCCQADSGPGGDAYFENCELIAWPGMGKQK